LEIACRLETKRFGSKMLAAVAQVLTKLCIRDLKAGEANGTIGYKPSGQ
jgi:hypothetical protein